MQPAEKADDSKVFEMKEVFPEDSLEPTIEPRFAASEPKADIGNGIEAEFLLESTAVCPHCLEDIERVQVVRMLRTKVNFVSSLPRRGQLLVCPNCRIALAGSLGGLI